MEALKMTAKPIIISRFWKYFSENPLKIIIYGYQGEFILDELSSLLWLKMDGLHEVRQLVIYIKGIYPDVEETIIREDIIKLLKLMESDDLIIIDFDSLFPHKKLNVLERIKL